MQRYRECSKIVLVDFDGTLCQFAYPAMGMPIPGARQFMKSLISRGLKPVVWSSRMSSDVNTEEERAQSIERIAKWLHEHRIPYDSIDTGNSGKRHCLAYVDDRGVAFTGSYEKAMRRIDYILNHHNAQVALNGSTGDD
jgi:hypothetical protein